MKKGLQGGWEKIECMKQGLFLCQMEMCQEAIGKAYYYPK